MVILKQIYFFLFILIIGLSCKSKTTETPTPFVLIPEDTTTEDTLGGNEDLGDNTTEPPSSVKLISFSNRSSYSKEQLQSFAMVAGYQNLAGLINSGAKTYFVEYQTKFKGSDITASGLIHVPDSIYPNTPLLSFQHGTMFEKSNAPSSAPSGSSTVLFAAAGYVVIEPDYIGYGSSSNFFHPYYHQNYSSGCVIDFIKASKEFLTKKEKPFSNSLFLAGYSEGGYVTLATHKEIQNNPSHNLTIKATAAGAGGYDLNGMLDQLSENNIYTYPAYLAFVIQSFDTTYNLSQSFDYFFNTEYAHKFPELIDGLKSGSHINSELTNDLNDLLNPEFYSNLKGNQPYFFKDLLAKNSIMPWNSTAPIRLYHGTSDEIIPFSNSESVYAGFLSSGSTSVNLIPIQGGTHGNSFNPMLNDFLPWFETLK